jgi:hypothetical protein
MKIDDELSDITYHQKLLLEGHNIQKKKMSIALDLNAFFNEPNT